MIGFALTIPAAGQESRNTALDVDCGKCHQTFRLWINLVDYNNWRKGTLIQRAMPYLNADERELLISRTCGECWERLWGKEE